MPWPRPLGWCWTGSRSSGLPDHLRFSISVALANELAFMECCGDMAILTSPRSGKVLLRLQDPQSAMGLGPSTVPIGLAAPRGCPLSLSSGRLSGLLLVLSSGLSRTLAGLLPGHLSLPTTAPASSFLPHVCPSQGAEASSHIQGHWEPVLDLFCTTSPAALFSQWR